MNALLPAAVGVLGGLIFGGVESVDWQIRGKGFDGDPRLGALRRAADELARDALARQAADLGLKPGKAPIEWVLDVSPARESSAGGEPFELGRTAFEGSAVVVTLPARKYLRSPERAAPLPAVIRVCRATVSGMGSAPSSRSNARRNVSN